MPLKKGNTNIGAIYKGTTQIAKIYKGTKLLFENAKWLDYYFNNLYNSLIPTIISGKTVQDKAKLTKIEGNGVVENQLVINGDFSDGTNSWTFESLTTTTNNNILSGTTTAINFRINQSISVFANHKYLLSYNFKLKSIAGSNSDRALYFADSADYFPGSQTLIKTIGDTLTDYKISAFVTPTISGTTTIRLVRGMGFVTGDTFDTSEIELTDLTLMFGTGNEPTDINDNRIQALLNRGYIAYNTGSYKNSKVSEIECKPYNLFDGTIDKYGFYLTQGGGEQTDTDCDITDFIEIVGGKTYTFEGVNPRHWSNPSVCYYDKDKNYLTGQKYNVNETTTFASPSNARYVRFTVDKTSTQPCFHLTGTRTGYAPYQAPTKITLPGLLDLNGAINSHDTFEITNTDYVFTRSIVSKALKDITGWAYSSTNLNYYANMPSDMKKIIDCPMICDKYTRITNAYWSANLPNLDKVIATNTGGTTIQFKDTSISQVSDTDAVIYYELATPQVITIPKKHLGCVDLGTLSWDVEIQGGKTIFKAYLSGGLGSQTSEGIANIYCSKYVSSSLNGLVSNDKQIRAFYVSSSNLCKLGVYDSTYSTAADFKSAMAGQYLFYETDAEVSDFDNIAQINAGGSITSNSEVLPNVNFKIKCKTNQ